jgi:hypothetical protein
LPVKEILERLGLPPFADGKPHADPPAPDEAQPDEPPQASPMDPSALISPVTDALGTLGNGLFEGVDPTAMLQGISQVFQSTGDSMKQSLPSLDDAWQGEGGFAAAAKTAKAITNGAEVGAQSDSLKGSLATAATNVAQARVRLIEIIAEFQATMAAIGPNIIFPWGWAAAIAAANKAIASTAEVMTELQTSLGAQAAQVTEAGAPVDVTAAPQAAASSAASSAGSSPMSSLVSPLMQMATKGAQAGIQAGTGAASAASQAAQQAATDPAAAAAGGAAGPTLGAAGVGGGGAGGGGVGGGGAAAPRSIATSAMVQPETASTTAQSAVRAFSGTAAGGSGGMMGGAPYAPMAGQGANNSSNSHTAAAFLHTTDQGGEIVGDLGTAAPPVLGEADPNEAPDVELRI